VVVLATVFANAVEAGRKAEDWAEVVGAVMLVSATNEAEGAGCEGHGRGAQGGALVYEEMLVFDPPELVRLVLTVLRKTVDPSVGGGGGAASPFCAEMKTEGT
jgi:hypothetical protein